jgi:hypothetical protein
MLDEDPSYSVEAVAKEAPEASRTTPDDLRFSVNVTQYDEGNQFIRYVLTFMTLFGVGGTKLRIAGDLQRGTGSAEPLNMYAYQNMGVFGGEGKALMRNNAIKIASQLARKITGRRILNRTAYGFALAALFVAFLNWIPYLLCISAPIGLSLSGTAVAIILQRDLQKRRIMAFFALGLNIAVSVLGLMLMFSLSSQ